MKTKIEVEYNKSNNRIVYKEYDNDGCIVGLNFMQGDDLESFKKAHMKNDHKLFEYALNHHMLSELYLDTRKDGEHRIASWISDEILHKIFWDFATPFENAMEGIKYLREELGYKIFMFKDTDVLKRKDTLDKEQCEDVLDEVESMLEDDLKNKIDFVLESKGYDEE